MRKMTMMLLALASTTVFAQREVTAPGVEENDSYRSGYKRGYDDGYARGYRKALEEGRGAAQNVAPPPPVAPPRSTGPIAVSGAVYGTSSKHCDATRYVARHANGKSTYSFDVSNDMCGDPARGDRKELNVTYICGAIAKTAQAYEHRTIYLDCSP